MGDTSKVSHFVGHSWSSGATGLLAFPWGRETSSEAMLRSALALSPKQHRNAFPANFVRPLPGRPGGLKGIKQIRGWKAPKYSATKMKWFFTLPYVRWFDSLHHYPEVSRVTGKPIDWYWDKPEDGYEGVRLYGPNTLELRGMPMGKTPEYMQERLRRFFSKFGPVLNCRANPHPMDPYQCEGTAYVTFRDKRASMRALRAPLKFPPTLHDKVVSMRHLDTDKTNDPNYYEKGKFWNEQLVHLAEQLHIQLSSNPEYRSVGKPLRSITVGLVERELVELETPEEEDPAGPEAAQRVAPWGRGGVPFSKGLSGTPTRLVAAGAAVHQRFGSWEAFLVEQPFDELFKIERRTPSESSSPGKEAERQGVDTLVVRPRLVSSTQRSRILIRGRHSLAEHFHKEFSVYWRDGKVPLPDYTKRRMLWWDHKPRLPFEIQVQSRSNKRSHIFDARFLYKRQLTLARNAKRSERRADWLEEKKKVLAAKEEQMLERRQRAMSAVEQARCGGLLGDISPRMLPSTPRKTATY